MVARMCFRLVAPGFAPRMAPAYIHLEHLDAMRVPFIIECFAISAVIDKRVDAETRYGYS